MLLEGVRLWSRRHRYYATYMQLTAAQSRDWQVAMRVAATFAMNSCAAQNSPLTFR